MTDKKSEVAIKVSHVSKTFKLPHEKNTSIKGALVGLFNSKKTYEKQEVLKDINFEIKEGEFFGIVGRNGSGKSTLLKLMAGIYAPNKGSIQINGKLTPFIELGVGFNPELTGRENIFLNGALLGFSRKEVDVMYEEIVAFAELKKFIDQKLKNYSSGMQVRLAFSVAIRAQSEILLLDEVLAVGDAAFQRKCYDYFMDLKKNKQTVILVTHDMGAVRQYCDRAVMINEGKITKVGDPEDVAQEYQKLFLQKQAPGEGTQKANEDVRHWGTGRMRAESAVIKVHKDFITISSSFLSKEDVESPIFGFTVYGPSGKNILEGNTLREKHVIKSLAAGQKVDLTWKVPNIFTSGTYEVSIAACNQNATEFYDWFNEAASFIITKEGNTAGIVDPPLVIESYRESNP